MHRRDVLRAGAGALALSVAGRGVAAQEESYEPLAVAEIEGAKEAAVREDGELAYVAASDGFATVDLSDPSDPTVLAEVREPLADRDGPPMRQIFDVWPDGDRLVVAGPANEMNNTTYGALLYDVSDPADPERLAFRETDHAVHNTYFEDGVVYLTGNGQPGNPVVLLDADDGLSELSRWTLENHEDDWSEVIQTLYPLHDVYVQDGLAYLSYWDAGLWILDVSDPANPEYVNHFGDHSYEDLAAMDMGTVLAEYTTPPGNAHYAQVDEDGTLLGVGKEAWAMDVGDERVGGPGGIDLWDVSDPTDPEHLSHIPAPESYDNTRQGQFTTAHNFDIVGDRLYSSWYFGGVKVHDVSDPTAPEEIAWWRDPEEASFWTAQSAVPDEFFVASAAADSGSNIRLANTDGLYVFPDRAGEQADPPSLTEPPEGYDSQDGGNQSDDAQNGSEGGGDDQGDENENGSENDSDGDGENDGSASIPGFGAGAAIAGLGAAAWRRRRQQRRQGREQ